MGRAIDREEGRPERLMAADQLAQAPLESTLVERPRDPHGRSDVEGGLPGRELVEEPQGLLGERQRDRGDPPGGLDRDALAPASAHRAASIRSASPETVGDSKSARSGISMPRSFAKSRDDLRRQQRVAAEVEEVVMSADPFQSQHAPQIDATILLERSRGAARSRHPPEGHALGGRQGLSVHLAVRGQRERLQHNNAEGIIGSGSKAQSNWRSSAESGGAGPSRRKHQIGDQA